MVLMLTPPAPGYGHQLSDADELEDLVLFDDLLGIADPKLPLPKSIRMLVGGG